MLNNQGFHDTILVCISCGEKFLFSEGEQRYFVSRGLLPPKHCPACRKKRRDAVNISREKGVK